jgi:hypothetical protein
MSADTTIGFAADIKPLFREGDRESMIGSFDLWSFDDVVEHSDAIADRLRDGSMPCDGGWPEDQVELFDRWIEEGMAP